MQIKLSTVKSVIEGEFYFNDSVEHQAILTIYATDASVYQEKPIAVAIPKNIEDLKKLIAFASENDTFLIPRTAGTSLAGQVVGAGIIVDVSKHFTQILEVNQAEKWVRVQPGVIRDDLNAFLKPFGLLFGPETSTANRAMIGGMIGNNSCGLHSIIWGATRDNLLETSLLLHDGSMVTIKAQNQVYDDNQTANEIAQKLSALLNDSENAAAIRQNSANAKVQRRNTGYALDALLDNFNLNQLIAGSEGTLGIIVEAKLQLIDLPPAETGIVAIHTNTLREAMEANLVALSHHCAASELVDDFILDFTKTHPIYSQNRFFIEGEPKTILMVEFFDKTAEGLQAKASTLINDLKTKQLGYAFPFITGEATKQVWDVRKAGLGLLRNLPGDTQPVNLIEDCAVAPQDLPNYVDDIEQLLQKHQVQYSMYAHAGAGELHIEPMINLKTTAGKQQFRTILAETAALVKKYGGSLSGEHGDGRLRGEFIPFMMGEKVYGLFREVKAIFDPKGIFNRGKITDTPPMNEFLRYEQDQPQPAISTIFDFSKNEGLLRLTEKCSGSGDCRKTEVSGGTMCPSFMATRSERDTTRARANSLRQFYTNPEDFINKGAEQQQVKEILDLCLSCKACQSECPSSVDIAKLKAEFLQAYYDQNGVPIRTKLIGNFTKLMQLASLVPWAYNFIYDNSFLRKIANKMVGFHPERTMPHLGSISLKKWHQKNRISASKKVYFFCDEFTNYNDVEAGKKAILLMQKLGYEVIIPNHVESGRTYLSKGLVRDAKKIAIKNVSLLKTIISAETPLVGLEPSAILGFRDEYLSLMPASLQKEAEKIAENALLFEEWFCREVDKKAIRKEQFNTEKKLIKLHGHCHQKAVASQTPTKKMLAFPANHEVHLINSGCCGMAGSFGYETEHYEVSMKVGELVLFPTVRKQESTTFIAAPGTSCRHQIKDGTGRIAQHPAEIMYDALVL